MLKSLTKTASLYFVSTPNYLFFPRDFKVIKFSLLQGQLLSIKSCIKVSGNSINSHDLDLI